MAAVLVVCVLGAGAMAASGPADADTVVARSLASLDGSASEISGLAASDRFDDLYWGVADSGRPNELLAIRVVGDRIEEVGGGGNVRRVLVSDASNTDWESVSVTDDGWVVIAETGNNSCRQTNARLYAVREPNPWTTSRVNTSAVWPLRFPDLPAGCGGIDVEATFTVGNEIYLVAKSSSRTRIYRLRTRNHWSPNDLVSIIDVPSPARRVTGAEVSADGRTGVLAGEGEAAWVFTTSTGGGTPDDVVRRLFGRSPTRTVRYEADGGIAQVESVALDPESPRLIMASEQRRVYTSPLPGASSPVPRPDGVEVVIDWGADWRYWAWGELSDSWRSRGFDHGRWRRGPAQIGYGEGDERTVPPARKMTTYFRRWVDIDDIDDVRSASISLNVDDGAAVFINGDRVATYNLRWGADFDEPAIHRVSGSNEGVSRVREIPLWSLREGSNLIAIEVHQASVDSSDLTFDARLVVRR